jgi:hypothetical protein
MGERSEEPERGKSGGGVDGFLKNSNLRNQKR